jgi:hypothetical protein
MKILQINKLTAVTPCQILGMSLLVGNRDVAIPAVYEYRLLIDH